MTTALKINRKDLQGLTKILFQSSSKILLQFFDSYLLSKAKIIGVIKHLAPGLMKFDVDE